MASNVFGSHTSGGSLKNNYSDKSSARDFSLDNQKHKNDYLVPRSCDEPPIPSPPILSKSGLSTYHPATSSDYNDHNYLTSSLRKASIDSNDSLENSSPADSFEECGKSSAVNNWINNFNSRLSNVEDYENIKLISSDEDLAMLFHFYYKTRYELQDIYSSFEKKYQNKLFPYLHGLNSINQREFFTDSCITNDDIIKNILSDKSIFNIMFINSSESPNITPNLINTIPLTDILSTNRVQRKMSKHLQSDCEVKEIEDIEEHIDEEEYDERFEKFNHIWQLDVINCYNNLNNRNYKDQIRLMAPLSNFVIYNYDKNDQESTNVAKLINTLRNKHRDQIIYVVSNEVDWNLIEMEYFDKTNNFESYIFENQLIPSSSFDLTSTNKVNYSTKLLKYEQQMIWRLNSMKRILGGKICLGNIADFGNLTISKGCDFKLIINCHEKATFPTAKVLNSIYEDFNNPVRKDNIYYLEFPSSGCTKFKDLSYRDVISYLNVLKLVDLCLRKADDISNVFIFSYDGFTGLSLLTISILHFHKFHSTEESILFLLNNQERDIKLHYFRDDIFFLKGFEKFIDFCKRIDDCNFPLVSLDYNKIPNNSKQKLLNSFKYDWFNITKDNNFPSKIYSNLYLGSVNHANSITVLDCKKIEKLISIGECPRWFKLLRNHVIFDFEVPTRRIYQNSGRILKPIYQFNENGKDGPTAVYEVDFNLLNSDIRKSPKLPKYLKSMIFIHNLKDDGKDSILPLLINCPPEIQEKILLKQIIESPTLVHCRIGVSRSASLVIASLMKNFKFNLLLSYLYVRVQRFNIIIQPNLKIFYELYLYEQYLGLRLMKNVQKFYPIALADKSWDNTGLLVDASSDEIKDERIKLLLTIDLTQAVADEAVNKKANLIMAYHPFIFRGLKSITSKDPQQRSLIKLIQNNISVYTPHTAVDSAKDGVNDFLADGIISGYEEISREAIEKDPVAEECGMGRLITLNKPVSLTKLVENIKISLGLKNVQVAQAAGIDDHLISTIAVCAGSGSGVFKGVKADLYYTGEISHHEALFFTESGSSVVACNHSNTERAFLKVMKQQLLTQIPDAEIYISETDKDPFQIW
ncbi:uncharacterized protein RJT21DRAFT_744 [Scheffersomyces amazonensis]|uniref:uncharacterized protein n=1 Tax=Scheffersomyces amazonensis TaxID=1078765 RepID=UPI00315D0AEA